MNVVFSLVHRFVRQCLSLLCALVSQGSEAAREVLSHIHINKTLAGLAKRKDKKVLFSVFSMYWSCQADVCVFTFFSVISFREAQISAWLLSSLCCPFWCLEIIQQLDRFWKSKVIIRYELEFTQQTVNSRVLMTSQFDVTELLPEILSTGLKEDRMSIVGLILSTLRSRVSVQQFTLFV